MNQSFAKQSAHVSNYAEVGDQVRVWLRSTNEQVRPQIVEGTLRQVRESGSIVVIEGNGTYRDLDQSIIGSVERVD